MIRTATLFLVFLAAVAARADTIAVRNVTVIPMTDGPPVAGATVVIAGATVVIRGDRIAAIGPAAEVAIPEGTKVVDGTGKYLIPGLVEMHAHLSKLRASSLPQFLLYGVTTVRDMGGDHQELLRWRREIRNGKRVGPRMLIAGPYLESTANIARMRKDPISERIEPFERLRIGVGSPEEARRIVASLASQELDFLKIRTVADRETYLALNAAADAHGIPLVGHVYGIPPEVVLQSGQDGVEHGFYPSLESDSRDERMATWRKFAARGVAVVPTTVTLFASVFPSAEHLHAVTEDAAGKVDPRRRYLSKFTVLDWREQVTEATGERRENLRKLWETVVRRDLREMHEAGVDVLAGSDAAVVNIFPGSTLHDELALFVKEIGMTPAEALDRATRRPARFLRLADSIGTIERGKIADLVLLDANPLDDIANTKRIAAVIVGGRLHDAAGLERLRASVLKEPDLGTDDFGRR